MTKQITETLVFCKRIETEWKRDFLPLAMLKEMGCNMGHIRTLARMGQIRVA